MQFVVFDVKADLAHFKKPFTTMSPQTFAFPTGTAVIGLIAAVLGLDKSEYWTYFPQSQYTLGIGLKAPVKKMVIPINLLKTDAPKKMYSIENRKPSTIEFLKDACFRIYFSWQNAKLMPQLVGLLQNHFSHYSISLGLANTLADYTFIGLYNAEQQSSNEWTYFASVLRSDAIAEMEFDGRRLNSNRIPVAMKAERCSRQVVEYQEYIFDNDGKGLLAKLKVPYYCLEKFENILAL